MSDELPSELVREILVQLPAESLFRFRSVCKAWLDMIDDPSFIKAHTNNQVYNHTLLVRNQTGGPLYSFSLDSLNFITGPQNIDTTRIEPGLQKNLNLSAFCNGLILINQKNIKKMWTIWNPLTGECHKLPQPNGIKHFGSVIGFGLGYDQDADDYKVVRLYKLYSLGKFVYQTLVYSLKSELLSNIEDCPFTMLNRRGTFWNGSLYWTSEVGIIALDLRTETYCRLPLPPVNVGSELVNKSYGLEALDGCLICSLHDYWNETFDGWVMKEKSWIKLFSLPTPANIYPSLRLRLVAYFLSKHQVLLQCDSGFLLFDIGNNSVLEFSIRGVHHINSSKICPGSLVRLNHAIGLGAVTAGKTLTRER